MKTALVMIVRDEARCIKRCLRSCATWVDSMIVLDTGSRDATPRTGRGSRRARADVPLDRRLRGRAQRRARPLTSRLESRARRRRGADRWLRLARGAARVPAIVIGRVDIDNAFDDAGGVRISRSRLPRLLPRGVRYAGRIHEQPDVELPRRDAPLRVAHDGYRDAAMKPSASATCRCCERALAETPDDAYLWYQLGKEHLGARRSRARVASHYRGPLRRAPPVRRGGTTSSCAGCSH